MKILFLTLLQTLLCTVVLFASDEKTVPAIPAKYFDAIGFSAQVLFTSPESAGASTGYLTGFHRFRGGWHPVLGPYPAEFGKKGIISETAKTEDDQKSPAGVYLIKYAFGSAPMSNLAFPFSNSTETDFWVTDPASPAYNTWVKSQPAAEFYEKLESFTTAMVIDYNLQPPQPGKGSAVFLSGRRNRKNHAGVSISTEAIFEIMKWLDIKQSPLIIISEEVPL